MLLFQYVSIPICAIIHHGIVLFDTSVMLSCDDFHRHHHLRIVLLRYLV
jgi:hypothetical protein